jgi:hypothetical protein
MKMSENKPKILEVIGSAFIKGILCPFYTHGKRLSHHYFPYKIGQNTLETNEADQHNETTFARFIIHFIINGFLRVRQNA